MKELEYPFDSEYIRKKQIKLRKMLLADESTKYVEKRIAVLGGSTTSDVKDMIELFLLNNGIKPSFYESEYNKYYEDGMFDNPAIVEFDPEIIYIHTSNRNIAYWPAVTDDEKDAMVDAEISAMLQAQYEKKGVEFHLSCKVVAIEGDTVVYENPEGETCRVRGDRILVSVGRRAVLQGFGLESLGVELAVNPAGRPYGIRVDEHMRTSVPGVYAAGDVTGFSMLAHTASREGEVAVNDILGKPDSMRYDAVPGVVYTNPEVAGTGLTETEAAAKGLDVAVLRLPMAFSGRFVAENERGEGLCKVVVDRASRRVLGVHMLGNPCSEIIQGACIAIEQNMTVGQLQDVIFPHPTVSEILKETVFQTID